MSRSQTARVLLVLLLAATLGAPCASAATLDVLSRVWTSLATMWAEVGCGIDPNGGCTTDTPPPGTDEGCGLDPHGVCSTYILPPPPSPDEGCSIDPHGICTPGS
jgi:hypothetical protein